MPRGTSNRSPGKGTLVDTWIYDATYATDGGDDADGTRKTRKVSVELRLMKDFDTTGDTTPHATKGVRFTLTCRDIDLDLVGTDIEALRLAMWEKLDARYRISWEPWLLVKVEPRSPYEGSGSGFTFSNEGVERGVAFDGSVLLRQYKAFGTRGYQVSAWPKEFKEKGGRTLACIPATDANRAALDEFSRRIDAMRRQLAEFVRPDAILQTLADIGAHMALAGQAGAETPRIGKAGKPEAED